MTKLEAAKKQFERAAVRLADVLREPKTEITRDSAILRFELALDLAWKTIKAFLEEKKGIVCASPKECFREAYRQGLIEYDEAWLMFVDMRNETMHTYKEEIAEKIYHEFPEVLKHLELLLRAFSENK